MPALGHKRHLDSPDAATRTCLGPKGPHPFVSEGSWNRICPKCAELQGRGPDAKFATRRRPAQKYRERDGTHDARTG